MVAILFCYCTHSYVRYLILIAVVRSVHVWKIQVWYLTHENTTQDWFLIAHQHEHKRKWKLIAINPFGAVCSICLYKKLTGVKLGTGNAVYCFVCHCLWLSFLQFVPQKYCGSIESPKQHSLLCKCDGPNKKKTLLEGLCECDGHNEATVRKPLWVW